MVSRSRARLTAGVHQTEREADGDELWSPELAVDEPAGEIEWTSMTTTLSYVDWWQEPGGGARERCSPSCMADHQDGGGASRHRWARHPIPNPRWASPLYLDPNAPTSRRWRCPETPGHGEPSCGGTPARHRGGGKRKCDPTTARLAVWSERWGRGLQGGAVDEFLWAVVWWRARELAKVEAAMVLGCSAWARRERERGDCGASEGGDRRRGDLEDLVAWLVGPRPAYGCHRAATRRRRSATGRPHRLKPASELTKWSRHWMTDSVISTMIIS
jgi:hypothetical protein